MFFNLITRNSRRSRKENGMFFATLLIAIIAFYIILSLSRQDVMLFLQEMESDAVNRLLGMIPVFYVMTLIILFFLIYFASKFQLERRRHEIGMYLMMGMTRNRLFVLLLAEDIRSSIIALLIGLPAAVLLSEIISLVTARLVGLGIIGHSFSLSLEAVLWTAAGFFIIKLAAFLILSAKISRREIGSLLAERPEETRRQLPAPVYALSLLGGILCLGTAYYLAIRGMSWYQIRIMGLTVLLGFAGTLLFFFGLRFVFSLILRTGKRDRRLHIFNVRQLQENVIRQSGTMAVSSLLILAALCCFGAGVAMAAHYGKSETHVLDYTFLPEYTDEPNQKQSAEDILDILKKTGLDTSFSELFEMKIGHIYAKNDDFENMYTMDSVMREIEKLPVSEDRDVLLNNLEYADFPHLISLSGYNELLRIAGLPELALEENEGAVYMDREFVNDSRIRIMNGILAGSPEVQLHGESLRLTGTVQSTGVVTDSSITLSFALILPDEAFQYYTQNRYDVYVNGVLDSSTAERVGLMQAISGMNDRLNGTGLNYESYLQNMGRQLFYIVAASYLTIYLAIIFIIVANTVIGVQFLMNQQKTNRRYKTLIRLGAVYEALCRSAEKQVDWYFGIPVLVAAASSLFAVRALFSGLLSPRTQGSVQELMLISAAMILVLCVIEYIYMSAVKRSSRRYLLKLMVPEREE
ncbi:ABC transporter permease [Mediterraneibacter glycyrrhizinilyticus]|uniref:ABC transporter permease n=1 Tax=Mediterraneibacter glycyrrhizinilyticus TaxID=342942 RepID=UPI0025AAF78C|nr:ABC transporter permease [Mediterraneibacter glycyrrhizinilyticus]MDN0043474.1 ABC transporter permease [Mediterraneibacter glycyrrhizinilyticus]